MHFLDRLLYTRFFAPFQRPWSWPKGPEREADWQPCRIRVEGAHWSEQPYELAGLYGPAEGPARGSIVLAHPTRPEAKGYFLRSGHARLLRDAGYHVLLFDFNGFGESPKVGADFSLEVLAAGVEAQRRAPDLPVGLLGVCYGASWGVTAFTYPEHPFRAAVLEGPYATLLGYYGRRGGKWDTLRARWILLQARTLLRLVQRLHPHLPPLLRPIDRVRHARGLRAMLLLYGDHDPMVRPEVGEQYLAVLREERTRRPGETPEAELWVVPGGRHLFLIAGQPEEYRRRVLGFFERTLAAAEPAGLQGARA